MGFGAGPGFSYPSVSFDAPSISLPSISVDDASLGPGLGATGGVDSSGNYSPSVSVDQAAANLALARSLTGPPTLRGIPNTYNSRGIPMSTTDPVVADRLGAAAGRAQALEDYQQPQEDAMAAALMGEVVGIEDSAPDYGSPVAPGIEDSAPDYDTPGDDFGNPDMRGLPSGPVVVATPEVATPDPTPGQGQMSGMGGAGSYDEKRARMRLLGINADPYAGHRYMAGGGQV
jgi:hypothetical protein